MLPEIDEQCDTVHAENNLSLNKKHNQTNELDEVHENQNITLILIKKNTALMLRANTIPIHFNPYQFTLFSTFFSHNTKIDATHAPPLER